MDISIQSVVERIKLQEKETDEKLKERREFEGAVAVLKRDIRDTTTKSDNLNRELAEILPRIDKSRRELAVERIRKEALLAQLEQSSKELDELRAKSDQGVSNIWQLRNSLCSAVQRSANEWNIKALLTKRVHGEISRKTVETEHEPIDSVDYQGKLIQATEKLKNAIKERERLLQQPYNGEEFVRLKNALRYSEEMLANLKNPSN